MIPFMGETVCRAFNLVFIPVFLLYIYIYDLLVIVGMKILYADNPAILHYRSNWQGLEGTLSQDMATLSSYLYQWKLKLSTKKAVVAAFHFITRKHEMSLTSLSTDRILRIEPTRSLTFR